MLRCCGNLGLRASRKTGDKEDFMRSALCIAISAVALCLTSMSFAAGKEAEYDIPFQQIRDTCNEYLEKCVDQSEVQQLKSKLNRRVKQRVSDNPDQSDDVAMRSIMLDWAAGASNDLDKRKPDAVKQACCYFVISYEKGFEVPHQIRAQLTPENVKDILDYLNEEIAKVAKAASKTTSKK
jgi:hypothetical protein